MKRTLGVVVAVLGCWYEGSEARADQLVWQAGLGIAKVGKIGEGGAERQRGSASDVRFSLDVGYRLNCRIALGGHLAWTSGEQTELEARSMDAYYYDEGFSLVELGVSPQILLDRLWLAPWAGFVYTSADNIRGADGDASGIEMTYGLSLGVDLFTFDKLGIGLFVSGYFSDGFAEDSGNYAFGLSFRSG